jgi:4-diphosphocytidyl-2-C-methyl-D-erythritol kinase
LKRFALGLPAPAKLNLSLQVVRRRPDGYHDLRTVFVAVGLADRLDFEVLDTPELDRRGDLTGPPQDDLAVRAARLLQRESGCRLGVRIDLAKRIPTGAGMGGGSSDAATTLIALNRLWQLDWPREKLAPLALALGADVPFFLQAGPALGEGVGERLTRLSVAPAWFAVIHPQVHVSTAEIFKSRALTELLESARISGFPEQTRQLRPAVPVRAGGVEQAGVEVRAGGVEKAEKDLITDVIDPRSGTNDLEAIVRQQVPQVDAAVRFLSGYGNARMTGSGAAVFAAFDTEWQAREAVAGADPRWTAWVVPALAAHPLACW